MIFYEKEEAEKILSSGFSNFMSFKDLLLLAKYFKYIGKNKTQIKKSLVEFCEKHNPDFNEILSRKRIENAIEYSQKYSLRLKFPIKITQKEIESIKSIPNEKFQKILFVMLAVAKYFKYNDTRIKERQPNKYSDNLYLNEDISVLSKYYNISLSKRERINMLHDFYLKGLILPTQVGSIQINFVNENDCSEIIVDDMNKLIDYFPFYCIRCGNKVAKKSKRHSMCTECYLEYRNRGRNY